MTKGLQRATGHHEKEDSGQRIKASCTHAGECLNLVTKEDRKANSSSQSHGQKQRIDSIRY